MPLSKEGSLSLQPALRDQREQDDVQVRVLSRWFHNLWRWSLSGKVSSVNYWKNVKILKASKGVPEGFESSYMCK